ncbi:Purine nucleoside phosphorylase [Entamoeba marina]
MSRLTEATLPASGKSIYHLAITEDDLADNIIVVGDPERVPKAAKLLLDDTKPIFRRDHRGLCTMTGYTTDNVRISIVTTGMGTGSTEIIINEILALKCIDVSTRTLKEPPKKNQLTSFVLEHLVLWKMQQQLEHQLLLNMPLDWITLDYFMMLNLVIHWHKNLKLMLNKKIDSAIPDNHRFKGKISPYVSVPHSQVVNALVEAAKEKSLDYKVGITASAAGFFICQGRYIFDELPSTIDSLDKVLTTISMGEVKVENFEMEMSCLTQITQNFKWVRCGGICTVVDNRELETFTNADDVNVDSVLVVACEALKYLDKN